MQNPRPRARRSRYRYSSRLGRSAPAAIAIVFMAGVLFGASLAVVRTLDFLHRVVNLNNPVTLIQQAVDPPAGSIAYKLKYGQPINILVLGYGGPENDAPYLTDSILVVSIAPGGKRVMEASIPRDLYVKIDGWQDGRLYTEKINTAFAVPADPIQFPGLKRPPYTGKDGPGHLSEDTLTEVTGIHFDKYVGVDFRAFRDTVDALGGVDVHMDAPLDDCHFPDYHDGYLNHGVPVGEPCPPGAGIHFKAGDYAVNGEQALQIARSRESTDPTQATDFGRSRRQQMIVQAIKRKAVTANGLLKAPQLMDALQNDFKTDLDLNDLRALYDWGSKLPDSAILRVALTNQDLLEEFYQQKGSCGPDFEYVLCAIDPSYRYLRHYFDPANTFVDPAIIAEQGPVQILNAISGNEDIDDRITRSLKPFGLNLAEPAPSNRPPIPKTVIYDYSGGVYPKTAQWLANYFDGAPVIQVAAPAPGVQPSPLPIRGQNTTGLVVVLGQNFYAQFAGLRQ